MMTIRVYAEGDADAVVALWHACELVVPWNDPRKDIARKLREDPRDFLVGEVDGAVVASLMFGYDGHRGWVNYLAVHPDHRKHGYGRALMDRAEAALRERGCPKINLQIRNTNLGAIAFYERIGFTVDPVASMGKRLEPDTPEA
jgi:ribosomal protein S18 acetylase RimI-like enzyme